MERRREGGRKKSQEDGMNEHTETKKGRKQAKPLEHSFKEEMSFRKCSRGGPGAELPTDPLGSHKFTK